MVQYYTLEEAARILGTSPDELKHLAKKGELRPFQDRGTLRFRRQEIDELARRRGIASDSSPDLQLGDAGLNKLAEKPSSKKRLQSGSKSPPPEAKKPGDAGVFDFTLTPDDDQVEIGQEIRGSGSASGSQRKSGNPVSPPPKPGSDSDVRLVADGSDLGFQISSDSDVKVVSDSGPASSVVKGSPGSSVRKGKPGSGQPDSSVRLAGVEPGSDSDVKIVPDSADDMNLEGQKPRSGSDSDIRLVVEDQPKAAGGSGKRLDTIPTEEIDLDAELRQAEEAARTKPPAKGRPKTKKPAPAAPFELSSDDAGKGGESTSDSSDFDLEPAKTEPSPVDLSSSDEISLQLEDEEVGLGELASGTGDSGINLQSPADSGISLEQEGSGDEIEFELSLDESTTPKPAKSGPAPAAADSEADSDSEFELTLDDSGGLAPVEEGSAEEGEKDIFETDFEVPALDEESGSQAVALEDSDTDLESSDFDLALDDSDTTSEGESGSQVVALEDEEEADEGAATVSRPSRRGAAAVSDEEEIEEILGDETEEGEPEPAGAPRRAAAAVPAADVPWGPVPAIGALFSVIFLFLATFMGLEIINSQWSFRQPTKAGSVLVKPFADTFGLELPKD